MGNAKYQILIKNPSFYSKQIILIIYSLISYCSSITTEIKIISSPYILLKNNTRRMSTQDIFGSAFKINYYYSNLYLGENKKKQGYILDTGSSITTSTCKQVCEKCGKHINPYHYIKNMNNILSCSSKKCSMVSSQCDKNQKCSFSVSYAEGSSLKGVYINELIRFGKNYKNQIGVYAPIGCTATETHLFLTQEADGIMGLSNTDKNYIDVLYNFGGVNKRIFGLCYGQLGGYFSIGSVETKYHKEKMKYVEMNANNNKYFEVDINNITVNNEKIKSYEKSKFSNFLDSGTTLSFIPNAIYDEIINVFDSECKKYGFNKCGQYKYISDSGACYIFDNITHLNNALNNFWPTISFFIGDYQYKWKPEHYFYNISETNKFQACIGFCKTWSSRFTFGSTWFIGHDVIFDRDNKLIGFAESDCFQNKKINETNGLEILSHEILEKLGKNKIIFLCVISSVVVLSGVLLVIVVVVIFKKKMKIIYKLRKKKADRQVTISENSSSNNVNVNLKEVNAIPDKSINEQPLKNNEVVPEGK